MTNMPRVAEVPSMECLEINYDNNHLSTEIISWSILAKPSAGTSL